MNFLIREIDSIYSQSEWTRTCKGISDAGRNRRIRIAGIKRGFDGRDQVEQIANLFYKIGMKLYGSTVFSRMEYLQKHPEKTGIHPAGF
jgi:hypothetical protein